MTKIKQGLTCKRKSDNKQARIGEQFDRDKWDEPRDPEWYVHFEGHLLKILPESVIKTTLAFDTV